MSRNTRFHGEHRRTRFVLPFLAALVAGLAVIASLVGLLWPGGVAPVDVTSIRGERVQLHGIGLYRYDTVFVAASSQGTDLVTLGLGVPLLVAAAMLNRRGSTRTSLVLVGAFAYFLYVYASRALYNA